MVASLAQLNSAAISSLLADGMRLKLGPFTVAVKSNDPALAAHLAACYPDYEFAGADEFAHCSVSTTLDRLGIFRRQAGMVRLDDGTPFSDYAAGEGLPYLEWGINWCVATRANYFLMLHAAVLERRGRALILPGLPGAGKSTLCTYLLHNGWRHLSDEFCLLRPGTFEVVPFPRLIPLKNESIDVIAQAVPGARIGPRFVGTRKGTVAHVSPLNEHVRCHDSAEAGLIVMPGFSIGAAIELDEIHPAEAFVELSQNSFNYQIMGLAGFETVAALAERTPAYRLRYGSLESAAEVLNELSERHF